MVSATVQRTAAQTTNTLQDRDIEGVAVIALSAAGGVIVAQVVADVIGDQIGISTDPNAGLKSLGLALASKLAVAGGFAVAGTSLGGLGLVAGAFMAVGSLASAGADALDFLLGSAPISGSMSALGSSSPNARSVATSSTSGGNREEVQFRGRSTHGGTKRPDTSQNNFR